MPTAVHFGAGNIGRGFIAEVLFNNDFRTIFVDINETVIQELKDRQSYCIGIASPEESEVPVANVTGLNNAEEPEKVIEAIAQADLITTAIGPNILPYIAELIAQGIHQRAKNQNIAPMDVIAAENMIGASQFLKEEIYKYLSEDDRVFAEAYIGFPNSAVDRIVPDQNNDDPLYVLVEPFSEWIIETQNLKNKSLRLHGVIYVEDLEPYIERKLFSVNTGHATAAYAGAHLGYVLVDTSLEDATIVKHLEAVLHETGELLIKKWGFDQDEHEEYIQTIIQRFKNPYIVDPVNRVARTPIRKLGLDERFIRPIRELRQRELSYDHLLATVAMAFKFRDDQDEQSMELEKLFEEHVPAEVVKRVTQLEDEFLIQEIVQAIKHLDQ